jgi:hypothetical protein
MIPGLALMLATTGNVKNPTRIIEVVGNDINLRDYYNARYPAPVANDVIFFVINPGVIIGASSISTWALQKGSWPEVTGAPGAPTMTLQVRGRIQGCGGKGGGYQKLDGGSPGGNALYVDSSFDLDTTSAQIWSGGGGGGNASWVAFGTLSEPGGGGAGSVPGHAGDQPTQAEIDAQAPWWRLAKDGTTEAGGIGFRADNNPAIGGGNGGNPGEVGGTAFGDNAGYEYYWPGGAPGYAINAIGNCRFGNWDAAKQEFVYTGAHGADIRGYIA